MRKGITHSHGGRTGKIRPGDVFPVDPAHPANYLDGGAGEITRYMLHVLGYRPHNPYRRWQPGESFTYNGVAYFWPGPGYWQAGSAPAKTVLAPGGVASSVYNITKIPEEHRVPLIESWYTPNPTTPWAANQWVMFENRMGQWDGTTWVFSTDWPPYVMSARGNRPKSNGQFYAYDPAITVQDATTAAALISLGYEPIYPWIGCSASTHCYEFSTFIGGVWGTVRFFWTGTAWKVRTSSTEMNKITVTPGQVINDANVAALPVREQCYAVNQLYQAAAVWTTGQSCTIAGQVYSTWATGYSLAPGPRP